MTGQPKTEVVEFPFNLAPTEEPWRVIDGLADFRALPPTSPTPPSTHLPFPAPGDDERRDTLETPVDDQRRIATVLQIPAIAVTTEIRRPALVERSAAPSPVDEERMLIRVTVGAVLLACLVFAVTLIWPTTPPPISRLPPPPGLKAPAAPAPPVVSAPKLADEWTLDPRRHRVDTLSVHAPDVSTQPRHRYLLSVGPLPKGAVVAARLDDVREGFGALYGLTQGRVLAVHGVKAIRLHCEPPEHFTAQTTLEVQLLDTATKERRQVSLRPERDCLDLSAGRSVRLTEPARVGLTEDPRRPARVAFSWRGADGTLRAGMLSPGLGARFEAGVVQLAIVSHSITDPEPLRFELGPADVEPTQRQVQYLTPALQPEREPVVPRPSLRAPEPDVWPRSN
jgi:hypothetical protein